MAFFEGLVFDESGEPLQVAAIGGDSFYVVNDQGFLRHVEARPIDHEVLSQFVAQIQEHRDEASRAFLQMLGQDDLFTKAMVDAQLRNLDIDQVLDRSLPIEARRLLGMMGLRIVLDLHGELVRVEMPATSEGDED